MTFGSSVNILSSTLTKNMQQDLDSIMGDAESNAIKKIKIYESKI